ncbi:MAG: hypothetical protein GXP55_19440 [Deltaproteobacteria bacterium]|nr:hypothetical protein [Deltaproteobacteria bacterium]
MEACGFERDDVIALYLEEPVATDYGFATFLEDPELRFVVPTLPGTMRFYATDDATRTLRSPSVSVTTSP